MDGRPHQDAVAAANRGLPAYAREVLALVSDPVLSYEDVAEIVGLPVDDVALTVVEARVRLAEELHGPTSFARLGTACWPSVSSAVAELDGEPRFVREDADLHAGRCPRCRVAIAALVGAATEYATWEIPAPSDACREEVVARVAREGVHVIDDVWARSATTERS